MHPSKAASEAKAQAELGELFGDAAVFRRLRSWSEMRNGRHHDADVWVFEQWLTLPRMEAFRRYLVATPPALAVRALVDVIRLAATHDPPGMLSASMLTLRGRLIDDHGICNALLLSAMLSCGIVRYVGEGLVRFSAPEMLTFPESITDVDTDLKALAETVESGPFMAPTAVACRDDHPEHRRTGTVRYPSGNLRPGERIAATC